MLASEPESEPESESEPEPGYSAPGSDANPHPATVTLPCTRIGYSRKNPAQPHHWDQPLLPTLIVTKQNCVVSGVSVIVLGLRWGIVMDGSYTQSRCRHGRLTWRRHSMSDFRLGPPFTTLIPVQIMFFSLLPSGIIPQN